MPDLARARRRLEAFWRAWPRDRERVDPITRSVVNDLALVLEDLLRDLAYQDGRSESTREAEIEAEVALRMARRRPEGAD